MDSKDKRVDSSLFSSIALDDIRFELAQTRKFQISMIQQGIIEPLLKTITTTPILVTPPDPNKKWFGVGIVNDGPNTIYVKLNSKIIGGDPIVMRSGDTWSPHFNTAIIGDFLMYTLNGSSTVRITGER